MQTSVLVLYTAVFIWIIVAVVVAVVVVTAIVVVTVVSVVVVVVVFVRSYEGDNDKENCCSTSEKHYETPPSGGSLSYRPYLSDSQQALSGSQR